LCWHLFLSSSSLFDRQEQDLSFQQVHFIGIGGSGLSAIATVLLERGYRVSGSDRQDSPLLQRLQDAGAQVFSAHSPQNVAGADLVVRSSAVSDDNPEVQAALSAGIPVLKRSEFLPYLTAGQQTIAIAGTHGKTTTTSMIAWLLTRLGLEPSFVIGGISANLGANARAGRGSYFVIEADEYDRMFLGLSPTLAVVTNVEHDHPDCYPTEQDFQQAFDAFAGRLEPGGKLLACSDDPGATHLLEQAAARGQNTLSYSVSAPAGAIETGRAADYQALHLARNESGGLTFDAVRAAQPPGAATAATLLARVALQVPGRHNVANALAALAVVDLLGASVSQAAAALSEFRGTGRRFEVRGEVRGITLVDDYAHHPTEIRATLAAARERYPGRPLWAVWQPHTYSRTRTLFDQFASAFDQADRVLVTEIYAAREPVAADGFSARQLVEAISLHWASAGLKDAQKAVSYAADVEMAVKLLLGELRGEAEPAAAVVLVLSAGDADQINTRLLAHLPDVEEKDHA
jgi:UDP-N-acetylmuramate--alanine ligase